MDLCDKQSLLLHLSYRYWSCCHAVHLKLEEQGHPIIYLHRDPLEFLCGQRKETTMRNGGWCAGRRDRSASVAETTEAPVFERAGPRFESHSDLCSVRRTDYPVAGTFKSRKPEMLVNVTVGCVPSQHPASTQSAYGASMSKASSLGKRLDALDNGQSVVEPHRNHHNKCILMDQ
uniref:Uncharacterized protein n=1 Tax=Anopheles culicifacies TaxID=139723 RepID=A0A182MT39_9DIPT